MIVVKGLARLITRGLGKLFIPGPHDLVELTSCITTHIELESPIKVSADLSSAISPAVDLTSCIDLENVT